MKKTVAIVGSHPRTNKLFDWNRTDCDVWVFNEAISNKSLPRADVVFQVHAEPIWRNPANRNDKGHITWLQTQKDIPVMMQDVYQDVPMSKKYPLENILDMVHAVQDEQDKSSMLSSSVALAVAYAVYLGAYERIEVWGVAMETNTEYQWQREGVAYWKGFAQGRGISFYFADPTFECPIYGYEGKVSVEYEEFGRRIDELTPELEPLSGQYRAALMDTQKALQLLADDGSKRTEETLFTCVGKQRELGSRLGFIDGAVQENARYKTKADKMREAAGEHIFSRQEFESGLASLRKRAGDINIQYISAGTNLDNVHKFVLSAAKGSPKRMKALEDYSKLLQEYMNLNNQIALLNGAANENGRYMAYLDKHIRAAGGAKSEEVLLAQMSTAEKGQ